MVLEYRARHKEWLCTTVLPIERDEIKGTVAYCHSLCHALYQNSVLCQDKTILSSHWQSPCQLPLFGRETLNNYQGIGLS